MIVYNEFAGGRVLGTGERPRMFETFLESAIVIMDINTNSRGRSQFSLSYSAMNIEVISVINLVTSATIKDFYSE